MTPADIRAAREALGLSQQQLAQRVGVGWQSVHRWETGKTVPLPLALKELQRVLRQAQKRQPA